MPSAAQIIFATSTFTGVDAADGAGVCEATKGAGAGAGAGVADAATEATFAEESSTSSFIPPTCDDLGRDEEATTTGIRHIGGIRGQVNWGTEESRNG